MGRRLDKLLRRTFRTSKFKSLLGLAVARIAVLKNQRNVRWSQDMGDVAQLLRLGHQERALLRVEHVIKEQNMLDAFAMIEGYCELLTERAVLIENQNDCPHELKEAISSLIFAASRCGELPELQEVRWLFTNRYGKEFSAAAVELRNSCGVNPTMIQKMSTKHPSLENRLLVLKEIAAEHGIMVTIEEPSPTNKQEGSNSSHHQSRQSKQTESATAGDTYSNVKPAQKNDLYIPNEFVYEEQLSGSTKARKYADVASAAQVAFESAAYAAAAARAAVELSRSESYDKGPHDDQSSSSGSPRRMPSDRRKPFDGLPRMATAGHEHFFEKIHPVHENVNRQHKKEEVSQLGEFNEYHERQLNRSGSEASEEEIEAAVEKKQKPNKSIMFDESDVDSEEEQDIASYKKGAAGFFAQDNEYEASLGKNQVNYVATSRYSSFEKTRPLRAVSQKKRYDAGEESAAHHPESGHKGEDGHFVFEETERFQQSNTGKRPVSTRTRRGF